MILATDNSVHFADLAKLKGRLASSEFDPADKDKNLCMDSILHAADISNPFKPFQIYDIWR
jgi:cAMP-specific phosphodiesterase 4